MFTVKRYEGGSTPVARPCPQTSSATSTHAQGYFSATIWRSWGSTVLPCHFATGHLAGLD
jgi:hypothetical protein